MHVQQQDFAGRRKRRLTPLRQRYVLPAENIDHDRAGGEFNRVDFGHFFVARVGGFDFRLFLIRDDWRDRTLPWPKREYRRRDPVP